MFMMEKKQYYTVSQIAKKMKLERTTIQKAIKNLVSEKLSKRIQKNLHRGGYTFIYKINNKDDIKKKMKNIIYEWYKGIETAIEDM